MKLNTQTLFAALAAVTLMTPACGGDAGKKDEKKDEKKTEVKADAPKADAPKADAPKADAPKADACLLYTSPSPRD